MSYTHNITRRDVIKATISLVGGLIEMTIGLPTIVIYSSPSLREVEDGSLIEPGWLESFPIDIHITSVPAMTVVLMFLAMS
jgi:hypothetical protein